jgi:threonine dehydratase
MSLDLDAIRSAHERIRAYIKRTPVISSEALDEVSGASLFFKCENLQVIGAFKARGATNAVFALDDATAKRGVATHSSGNHGAAVARAAKLRGIPSHVVAIELVKVKLRSSKLRCESFLNQTTRPVTLRARVYQENRCDVDSSLKRKRDGGAGTGGQLLGCYRSRSCNVSVGGGGLLSGLATAGESIRPQLKVIAAEPPTPMTHRVISRRKTIGH